MTKRKAGKPPKYARAIPVSEREWNHALALFASDGDTAPAEIGERSRRIYNRMRMLEKKVYRDE